jgi:hypothetical protein
VKVGDFLGIHITKQGSNVFILTQAGLIDKSFKTAGMQDAYCALTPSATVPVGADQYGNPFIEEWTYATVVGQLMYISANTRPYIAYAVHQAAQYTHAPKNSHAVAVKRILCYLRGTQDKGIIFKPTK